jgi:hypothetical protein
VEIAKAIFDQRNWVVVHGLKGATGRSVAGERSEAKMSILF